MKIDTMLQIYIKQLEYDDRKKLFDRPLSMIIVVNIKLQIILISWILFFPFIPKLNLNC
jgi:hypothetical protein